MRKKFGLSLSVVLFIGAAVLLLVYETNYSTTYASDRSIQERWVTDIDLIGLRLVALEDCVTALQAQIEILEGGTGSTTPVSPSSAELCNLAETDENPQDP